MLAAARAVCIAGLTGLSAGCGVTETVNPQAVLAGYRTLAHANYSSAYQRAGELQVAVAKLEANPSPSALKAAREAWRDARLAYARTESLQFGHGFVSAWHHRVTVDPIDAGFLDYVGNDYSGTAGNPHARLNLIAAPSLMTPEGEVDTQPMRSMLLVQAHGLAGRPSNAATGYAAQEFVLWGQQGQRPWTDFALNETQCTDGAREAPLAHCQRRRAFLRESTALLRRDLRDMASLWGPQRDSQGDRLVEGNTRAGLRKMLTCLIVMSRDELAGRRLQALLAGPETAAVPDRYSGYTYATIQENARAIEAYYHGQFGARDVPASLSMLAEKTDSVLAKALEQAFTATRLAMQAINAGGDVVRAPELQHGMATLRAQAELLEQLQTALGLDSTAGA